jgi:hypothetical protein
MACSNSFLNQKRAMQGGMILSCLKDSSVEYKSNAHYLNPTNGMNIDYQNGVQNKVNSPYLQWTQTENSSSG